VALYWKPFFKGRVLGSITATDIDAFITYMGDKALSAARKNQVIMAGTKALRWAFSKGKIEADPTRGHILFSGEEAERQILTPTAAAAIFRVAWKDERAKLANMLAAVTGMRQGEILALRFQDLGSDCLYVNHSWGNADGLKTPKNNETRVIELPFPDLMNGLIELAKRNPWGVDPESFIFWTERKNGIPMAGRLFVDGLRDALVKVGFTADNARKYLFHGWRHFYTSYMIGKIDKKLLKSQTGHRTDSMLWHYSDHQIAGDRERLRVAQIETFGDLVPSGISA
jgi:integrase